MGGHVFVYFCVTSKSHSVLNLTFWTRQNQKLLNQPFHANWRHCNGFARVCCTFRFYYPTSGKKRNRLFTNETTFSNGLRTSCIFNSSATTQTLSKCSCGVEQPRKYMLFEQYHPGALFAAKLYKSFASVTTSISGWYVYYLFYAL